MNDEAIHAGHCSVFQCVYGSASCPVVEVDPGAPRGGAAAALAVLAASQGGMAVEHAVRASDNGWVYALPKLLPKFLEGKRGTREAAEWHRRQVAGPDPEDWTGFEIVRRPVGPWEIVTDGDQDGGR